MIKLLFLCSTLTLAQDFVYPGYIYVSSIGNSPAHVRLGVQGVNLTVTTKQTFFTYGKDGSVSVVDYDKFLSFDNAGRLVLDSSRDRNFRVSGSIDLQPVRNLTYIWTSEFELCGDRSIGYGSNCEGAVKIRLTYEDFLGPRRNDD